MSKYRTVLLVLCVALVLGLIFVVVLVNKSEKEDPLRTNPMYELPSTVIQATGISLTPSFTQLTQIAQFVSASGTVPYDNKQSAKTAVFARLAEPATGPVVDQDLPFLGSGVALGWLGNLNPVLAFLSTDDRATSTWLDSQKNKGQPALSYTQKPLANQTLFLVQNPTSSSPDPTDTNLLTPGTQAPSFGQIHANLFAYADSQALLGTWVDVTKVAKVSNLSNNRSKPTGWLAALTSTGLLSSEATGQVSVAAGFKDSKLVATGQYNDVKQYGLPVLNGPKTNLQALYQMPDTALVAGSITDPGESSLVITLLAAVGINASVPETITSLPNTLGSQASFATGPATQDGQQVGWVTIGGSVENSQNLVSSLSPDAISWTVNQTPNGVVTATSPEWAQKLTLPVQGKTLADTTSVKELTKGADDANAAFFVNASSVGQGSSNLLWPLLSQIGIVAKNSETDGSGTFTVTATPR